MVQSGHQTHAKGVTSALTDVDTAGWTQRFDLLSDPNRLEILLCLHRAPGIFVGDLAAALGIALSGRGWAANATAALTGLVIPAGGAYDIEPCHLRSHWIHQLMQMVGEGHRRPFLRVGLDLICNQFGQRITEVVAWPRRVHPISETRREKVAVSADDVRPDAHLGDGLLCTELVRQADTGVQRNRLPGRGDPRLLHPMVPQEARRGIGAVDFEPLIAVGVLGDTKVVQHAAEEYQLVVIVDIGSQPLGGGELATV